MNKRRAGQVLAMCDQWNARLRDGTATAEETKLIQGMLHELIDISTGFKLAAFLVVLSCTAESVLNGETKKGEG